MNIFVVLAVAAFLASVEGTQLEEDPKLGGIIDWGVNATINVIVEELDEIFDLNEFNIPIKNPYIKGNISVDHVEIIGIKKMVATAIRLKVLPHINADLTFSLPNLTVAIYNYSVDLKLFNIVPLVLKGNISFSFNEFDFLVIAGVKKMAIDDLQFCMNMKDSQFHITGLYNKALSQYVSKTLTETIAPFVNNFAARITEFVSPLLKNVINSDRKTLETILSNFEGINELN
ncbi:unnamed protein product [Brassicogethes aeneus]|uniref:Uncharacterized protein n=1 Tax=Brassicogethes aeneus TaxID=1431903 RepID=A0A9P0B829_BRAAE|nr:unnamed protein product [Brassicogethes aeneus]